MSFDRMDGNQHDAFGSVSGSLAVVLKQSRGFKSNGAYVQEEASDVTKIATYHNGLGNGERTGMTNEATMSLGK